MHELQKLQFLNCVYLYDIFHLHFRLTLSISSVRISLLETFVLMTRGTWCLPLQHNSASFAMLDVCVVMVPSRSLPSRSPIYGPSMLSSGEETVTSRFHSCLSWCPGGRPKTTLQYVLVKKKWYIHQYPGINKFVKNKSICVLFNRFSKSWKKFLRSSQKFKDLYQTLKKVCILDYRD